MKKKFLKGVVPVLLVVVMCMIQLLPVGAVVIVENSDEEIAMEGANAILTGYAFLPEFFGVSGANTKSYDFDGTMTAENADRIVLSTFFSEAWHALDTYITEEGLIVIPEENMKAMIAVDFMIENPDVRLSKLYDPQRNAIIITEALIEDFPLDRPYCGVIAETQMEGYTVTGNKCKFSYHFINLDRSHSLRVAVEFEFEIEKFDEMDDLGVLYDMYINLCSFQVLEENEMLEFVNGSKLHMEQNWYLCGGKEKMTVSDFQAQFKQNDIFFDNGMETERYVGTGNLIQLVSDAGAVTDSVCVVIKGDIDGDGNITSTDYLRLKSFFKGEFYVVGPLFKAADIDNSGKLDSTDYLRIKKYMNGAMDLYAD